MKAMVVEKYSQITQVFIEGLNEATGCNVYHAQSLDDGFGTMQEKHVDLILVNLDQESGEGWRVAERIRSESRDALTRCPHMIFLSDQPRSLDDAVKCRNLDAMCMLRQSFAAIFEEARVALRMRLRKKMKSTIRIEYHSGHFLLFFCAGMATPKQILVGFQVAKLVALLAGGLDAYTVEAIADALGVCRQTVKKYMWELRNAAMAAQAELMILESDKDVFWVARGSGGTCCGIKANVIWS